ncbi:MAG: PD-(D/E)XK nuclease family protein [Limnochordaceae bacterium]|nr:PD-(D/E)XK nuclease family protein [Limnochordaceae bacterium]
MASEDRARWEAIATVYEAVSERLVPVGGMRGGGEWADGAAVWWMACQAVRAGEAARRLGGAGLVLWGVDALYDPGHLWHLLRASLVAAGSGTKVEEIGLPGTGEAGEASCAGAVQAASVTIVSATDEVREGQLAAQAVLDAARRGVPLARVAVVVRSRDAAGPVLDALARAGVEPFAPGVRRVAELPGARALLGWLEVTEQGLPRAQTIEWLASSPLRPEWLGSIEDRWMPVAWDALSARAGITAGLDAWERRIAEASSVLQEEPGWPEFARAARTLVARARQWPQESSWAGWAAACSRFVQEALRPGEAMQQLMGLLQGLSELDALVGAEEKARVAPARFREILASALHGAAIPTGHFEQGRPAVLDAPLAAGCSFDTVVVAGLNDPVWPRPAEQDPLLGVADLQRLGLGTAGERAAWHARRERLYFAAAVGAAERILQVSWPRAEAISGRERMPSPLLQWLQQEAPAAQERQSGGAAVEPLDLASFDAHLAARMGAGAEPYLTSRYPRAAAGALAQRQRWSRSLTEWDGRVEAVAQATDASQPATLELTPTGLERYARCPRAYFFERALGISEEEAPEEGEGLEGFARGRVVHRALELFFRWWAGQGAAAGSSQERREVLAQAVDQAMAQNYPAVAALPGVARIQRDLLVEALARFIAGHVEALRRDGWQPIRFEEPFCVRLADLVPGLEVRLRGRIDRVDEQRAGETGRPVAVRVIDYKTSRPRTSLDGPGLKAGTDLQLPVYLLAASRLAGLEASACRASFLFLGADGTATELPLDGAEWAGSWPHVERAVATLAGLLAAGSFPPLPRDEQDCRRCTFYVVCGPEARRQGERKASDALVRPLVELRAPGDRSETGGGRP